MFKALSQWIESIFCALLLIRGRGGSYINIDVTKSSTKNRIWDHFITFFIQTFEMSVLFVFEAGFEPQTIRTLQNLYL